MIRTGKRYSPCFPALAACALLALGGCDRDAPPPEVQPPPAAVAPVVDETLPAAGPRVAPEGPSVLTEVDAAALSVAPAESGLCSFDTIDGQPIAGGTPVVVGDPAHFTVSGWVGEKATMTRPAANLRLTQVGGARSWEITAGPPRGRGDVANHFDADGLSEVGFEVSIDPSELPPGEYGLSLVHQVGGQQFICDKGTRIRIEG